MISLIAPDSRHYALIHTNNEKAGNSNNHQKLSAYLKDFKQW